MLICIYHKIKLINNVENIEKLKEKVNNYYKKIIL